MHDQLFNADSFRRIFDLENRKGNDLATRTDVCVPVRNAHLLPIYGP
jgi:hypothetical protein